MFCNFRSVLFGSGILGIFKTMANIANSWQCTTIAKKKQQKGTLYFCLSHQSHRATCPRAFSNPQFRLPSVSHFRSQFKPRSISTSKFKPRSCSTSQFKLRNCSTSQFKLRSCSTSQFKLRNCSTSQFKLRSCSTSQFKLRSCSTSPSKPRSSSASLLSPEYRKSVCGTQWNGGQGTFPDGHLS